MGATEGNPRIRFCPL